MEIKQHCQVMASGVGEPLRDADLVLFFAERERLGEGMETLRDAYPDALLVGCSGAGEICGNRVHDQEVVAVAISFEHTQVRLATAQVEAVEESPGIGERLAQELMDADLSHVLVISDGLRVNGSGLIEGFTRVLPPEIAVTGGLSGDGERFARTLVCANASPREGQVAAIGFYGKRLRVGYGSIGGWDPFGPDRIITRSQGNVLYELDGQSALELYKRYLADQAAGLPASALLFPLAVREVGSPPGAGVVRTVLSVDEDAQSMTFAGDMPEGMTARLMKANFERLIDGAADAARACNMRLEPGHAQLALLISCIGRRLVLGQRVEEEIDGVQSILGEQAGLIGFYSYGEISPNFTTNRCELHNQTMTVTTFAEE